MSNLNFAIKSWLQYQLMDEFYNLSTMRACAGIKTRAKSKKTDVSVADYMAINNYGSVSQNIPPRPWLDYSTKGDKVGRGYAINKDLKNLIKERIMEKSTPRHGNERAIALGSKEGQIGHVGNTPRKLMKAIADTMAESMIETIKSDKAFEPKSPETERRSGSTVPLIDTGLAVRSIRGWVETGQPGKITHIHSGYRRK